MQTHAVTLARAWQYTAAGVDWAKLSEEELALAVELPMQPFLPPPPSRAEREARARAARPARA